MAVNIAILASGSGSNAEKIIEHFQNHPEINVKILLSNNSKAGALDKAQRFNIPVYTFDRNEFYNTDNILLKLQHIEIDLVILAGFLWLIPESIIRTFEHRIINIHPALLPKYGGKGMYGKHVHQAVFDNKESESGMTIHLVNEAYDKGEILFQESVSLDITDTPDVIAKKVLALEHANFAKTIEKYALALAGN